MYSLILSEMVYPMPLWILIVKVALDFGMADSKSSSWLRNRGGGEELWIFYMYTRQLRSAIYIRPNCSTVYYSNMCGNRTFLHRRLDFCPVEYNVNIYINCPSQHKLPVTTRGHNPSLKKSVSTKMWALQVYGWPAVSVPHVHPSCSQQNCFHAKRLQVKKSVKKYSRKKVYEWKLMDNFFEKI
jgi:hypothetical protein